jgi:hypothetical protein
MDTCRRTDRDIRLRPVFERETYGERGPEETYGAPFLGNAANAANGDLRPLLSP